MVLDCAHPSIAPAVPIIARDVIIRSLGTFMEVRKCRSRSSWI